MLELITKIRSRKWLFLLLVAPLIFTPVKVQDGYSYFGSTGAVGYAEWEYVGIALAGPLFLLQEIAVLEPHWDIEGYWKRELFIDWGRIAYWELWVLLIYFCIVPIVPWRQIHCPSTLNPFQVIWNWYMKHFTSKPSEENKQKESE